MKMRRHILHPAPLARCLLWAGLCLSLGCFALQAQQVKISDDDLDLLESEDDTPKISIVPLNEFERSFQEFLTVLTREYDERFPVAKEGEFLELLKPNGIVDSGTYTGQVDGQVQLMRDELQRTIPLTELRVQDRLRLDSDFRSDWLNVLARSEARQHFLGLKMVFKTYNLGLRKQFAEALLMSDSGALYRTAKDYRGGIKQEKDFGYSFLYTSVAAQQGLVDARYDFGRMFYAGIGTSQNKRVGLQWIASAASENHEQAKNFLEHHKISKEMAQKAAEAQLQAEREEFEAHDHRLRAIEEENASRVIIRGRKSESSFN